MTTITQEQFEAAVETFHCTPGINGAALKAALATIGITIAPPAPSGKMVKLAREIVATMDGDDLDNPCSIALAALRHAEKAVRDAPAAVSEFHRNPGAYVERAHILNQIGAE